MFDYDDGVLKKMEKGWAIAMRCSEQRLQRIYEWTDAELNTAVKEGMVMLETVCVFVHGCIKSGQYKLPADFWKILHAEYGIIVYPSALTENVAAVGVGASQTFSEVYSSHIVMLGRRDTNHPPLCPFEYIKEPLPVYEK
ncbi:uncharacterized protein TrAFT101_009940 [Trichoderma asperellum]|nr:hypothetical protein LI328DRAFT_9907 [Trichoderma asperelloides]UKZ95090.1 hypothetical protein TrAFT101_009940 [Trichoderma asperellum]